MTTETTAPKLNEQSISLIASFMMDAYNIVLSGTGLEEFLTKYFVLKDSRMHDAPLRYQEILLAINIFHAQTILDVEQKAERNGDKAEMLRKNTIESLARALEI